MASASGSRRTLADGLAVACLLAATAGLALAGGLGDGADADPASESSEAATDPEPTGGPTGTEPGSEPAAGTDGDKGSLVDSVSPGGTGGNPDSGHVVQAA